DGSGNSDVDGIYVFVGLHNGENLYESDGFFIYYDGSSRWLMNDVIDNTEGLYYLDELIGYWFVDSGESPAPLVSAFSSVSSESSSSRLSSSSFDFSSTSSLSSLS